MKYIWLLLAVMMGAQSSLAKECVYVNAYHKGYAWSDGIEQAVRLGLQGKCHLTVFYMDTKRNTATSFGEQKGREANILIEKIKPDVLLASDDNASKYLVKPYYKNATLPVVFSGINWSAKAYGYPYSNATGMIEVSAIHGLLRHAREAVGKVKSVAFIGVTGVRTDEKEFAWLAKAYAKEGVQAVALYAATMQEWEAAYRKAQQYDFIMLNNIAGIKGWDAVHARKFAAKYAEKFSVTTYDFMSPYAMFAMTKIAAEQGEWMVQLAIHILQGKSLKNIPVVTNRRWNMFANLALLQAASIHLPESTLYKAVKVAP